MGSLVEDLSLPRAFGADERNFVERLETHISWVFLVGERVFKLKKPVSLGFLDFSTLEKRKRACDAEISLNRRLAPDVYRGVVPITRGADERLRIGGAGEVIEWAVEMVRLPDSERADVRLTHGALGAADIARIAECLAAFHASAPVNEATTAFGAPDKIAINVRENFEQTRASVGQYLAPSQAAEIERWQLEFLERNAHLFADRMRRGRVRDGHGDLRLEHTYLRSNERVTVIDCIEFNDRFRYADVCADLAFLSMDLEWHGRVDLAEQLLALYARAANDYDLFALADFYEGYRAYVRAKISAMVADDEAAPPAVRERAGRDARRYFLLALATERKPLLPPTVTAVGGIIASGKSTVANAVGAELSAPVVDADRTRKWMLGVAATEHIRDPAWSGAYDPAFTEKVYGEVLRRAEVVLASGRPVVIDASFRSAAMRRAARDLASRFGVPFRMVECSAPIEVCRERLVRREAEERVSDGRNEILAEFCARFEPMSELSPDERLVIDTAQPLAGTLATLRSWLGAWPAGLVG